MAIDEKFIGRVESLIGKLDNTLADVYNYFDDNASILLQPDFLGDLGTLDDLRDAFEELIDEIDVEDIKRSNGKDEERDK